LPDVCAAYMLVAYMAPDAFTELKKGSAETLVLAVLEDGPRHGYELAKEIDRRSAGRLVFHVATLYTTLYRMEHDGLIAGRWVEKPLQRRRRFYRMTAAGRRRLSASRRHWQDFVSAIDGVVLKPVS
jgi:PadR family transcriptional regulator, regulatory protein PadR